VAPCPSYLTNPVPAAIIIPTRYITRRGYGGVIFAPRRHGTVVSTDLNLSETGREAGFVSQLGQSGGMIRRCVQCGTCTASCPLSAAMDITPRRMWRMVSLGLTEEVLHSKTMWLCSMCYKCQVRCPRGIPLTELIARLKQTALDRGQAQSRASSAFYRTFAQVMRRYGRVRELEFMARYFLASDPVGALSYSGLGLAMFKRGKIALESPSLAGAGRLDRLFARVAELEGKQ
jgi:heterodisulfide reductase subunit C